MSLSVFLMVIAAAILHAGWNVLVKINADKIVTITLIKVTQICLALMLIPFVEFPAQAAWPYMVSSAVIHTAYFYALTMSYRLGEFGYVYPVSRGTAPLVVCARAGIASKE